MNKIKKIIVDICWKDGMDYCLTTISPNLINRYIFNLRYELEDDKILSFMGGDFYNDGDIINPYEKYIKGIGQGLLEMSEGYFDYISVNQIYKKLIINISNEYLPSILPEGFIKTEDNIIEYVKLFTSQDLYKKYPEDKLLWMLLRKNLKDVEVVLNKI